MRKVMCTATIAVVLMLNFSLSSTAQTGGKTDKESEKNRSKIESNHVPAEVNKSYERDYPLTPIKNWYNYDPAFAGDSWEEYDPYDYSRAHAKNYQVDFEKGNLKYSVVYTSDGKKVLIRRSLTSDIPKAVLESINKTKYKNWILGKDKEEIFKNEESDNVKICKVTLIKGNERHILYFNQNGKLMTDINSGNNVR